MADFEIIEADFQQFYNIDVSTLRFQRFARLLINLPLEARFIKKYVPSKDWDFDKETQSRILMMLDVISCQLSNIFKKKSAKPKKPAEQFQPDYVKQAKKDAENEKKMLNKDAQEDLAELFAKRNDKINKMEGTQDG